MCDILKQYTLTLVGSFNKLENGIWIARPTHGASGCNCVLGVADVGLCSGADLGLLAGESQSCCFTYELGWGDYPFYLQKG